MLGSSILLLGTPLIFVYALVACFVSRDRGFAIAGAIATGLLLLVPMFLIALFVISFLLSSARSI